MGESGDKAENEFSGFIPLAVPRKGFSPHIPAPRLFVHFHTTMPKSPPNPSSIHQVESIQFVGSIASFHPKKRNIPYWYCLQCTPSLTLPPSSLKCLQNYNPNIHRQCFGCSKCFGCFRCFISLLDHKTARFWSKSEQTRKIGTHPPSPNHGYGKHPKRQSTHLPASPHTMLSAKL